MKSSILLVLSIIALSLCADDEFPIENSITILTNATFDKALEKYESMFVMFYAPWCGHCKKFKPELEKAAEILRKENLIVAKVDATEQKDLASRCKIKGYPTVKFFKKGAIIDYKSARKADAVVDWVRKKAGAALQELKTEKDVEAFKDKNKVGLVFFGTNGTDIKTFEGVALDVEEYPFAIVKDAELAKKYKAKQNSVVLFKKFDEGRNELEFVTETRLREFIDKHGTKRVADFDEEILDYVFEKQHSAIAYFGNKGDSKWKEAEVFMESLAEKLSGKYKVIMTDPKSGMPKRVAEYVGVTKEQLPAVRLLDTRGDLKKYIMEGNIDEKSILDFIEAVEKGKIKPFLKTQEEPKENNGPIFELVGKSFEREVLNNDKDVMVVFYAPWCGHCKKLLPKYEEAAKLLKEKNPKLLLSKLDATENEVDSIDIRGFPTIVFYAGDKKDKRPIDFRGERTVDGIISFIKKHAHHPVIYEAEKKEEVKKEEEKKEEKKKEEKNPDL